MDSRKIGDFREKIILIFPMRINIHCYETQFVVYEPTSNSTARVKLILAYGVGNDCKYPKTLWSHVLNHRKWTEYHRVEHHIIIKCRCNSIVQHVRRSYLSVTTVDKLPSFFKAVDNFNALYPMTELDKCIVMWCNKWNQEHKHIMGGSYLEISYQLCKH